MRSVTQLLQSLQDVLRDIDGDIDWLARYKKMICDRFDIDDIDLIIDRLRHARFGQVARDLKMDSKRLRRILRLCLEDVPPSLLYGHSAYGPRHPGYDHTVYHWVHDNGAEERATRWEMYNRHGLHDTAVMAVIRGGVSSTGGWRLAKYSNKSRLRALSTSATRAKISVSVKALPPDDAFTKERKRKGQHRRRQREWKAKPINPVRDAKTAKQRQWRARKRGEVVPIPSDTPERRRVGQQRRRSREAEQGISGSLSNEQVKSIRADKGQRPQAITAEEYCISVTLVSMIQNQKRYANVS